MIKGIQHLFPFIILLSSLSSCLFKASDESDVYTGVDESCDKLPKCEPLNSAPYSKSKDFSFWYWPKNHRPVENWPTVFTSMHFLTGHYGAVYDEASGQLLNLGSFSGNLSMNASALRSVDELTSLPSASISFQTGTTQSPVTAMIRGNFSTMKVTPGAISTNLSMGMIFGKQLRTLRMELIHLRLAYRKQY